MGGNSCGNIFCAQCSPYIVPLSHHIQYHPEGLPCRTCQPCRNKAYENAFERICLAKRDKESRERELQRRRDHLTPPTTNHRIPINTHERKRQGNLFPSPSPLTRLSRSRFESNSFSSFGLGLVYVLTSSSSSSSCYSYHNSIQTLRR